MFLYLGAGFNRWVQFVKTSPGCALKMHVLCWFNVAPKTFTKQHIRFLSMSLKACALDQSWLAGVWVTPSLCLCPADCASSQDGHSPRKPSYRALPLQTFPSAAVQATLISPPPPREGPVTGECLAVARELCHLGLLAQSWTGTPSTACWQASCEEGPWIYPRVMAGDQKNHVADHYPGVLGLAYRRC